VVFEQRELLVVALGGNALSPPDGRADGYEDERNIIATTGPLLDALADRDYRLLVVHGNGPQVGRLLKQDTAADNLDIHIAQTQGELGYLLSAASREQFVCLTTRVIVDANSGPPVKPIGPWQSKPAESTPGISGAKGWRRLVPSPRPLRIIEEQTIAILLRQSHVIAGGGGGIPVSASGKPVAGVIDKDWTASHLAIALNARALIFATDVDGVYRAFGQPTQQLLHSVTCSDGLQMIERDEVDAGAMAPKLESATEFASSTGRAARICHLNQLLQAIDGRAGTQVVRDQD
jgi:carbamate kinase